MGLLDEFTATNRVYAVCLVHLILCILMIVEAPGDKVLKLGATRISPALQWANTSFSLVSIFCIIQAVVGSLYFIESHLSLYWYLLIASVLGDVGLLGMFVVSGVDSAPVAAALACSILFKMGGALCGVEVLEDRQESVHCRAAAAPEVSAGPLLQKRVAVRSRPQSLGNAGSKFRLRFAGQEDGCVSEAFSLDPSHLVASARSPRAAGFSANLASWALRALHARCQCSTLNYCTNQGISRLSVMATGIATWIQEFGGHCGIAQ
eukprot:CAMPEP_0115092468 /NCGR_PEP_ID=MMETSP0227-20121206/26785_1 /TAXON_ID=89957 /ORGANISM="Polarella glacialis, Strain CCMP 1383" /LENGTH=263 /DNA_ID=CAMNT_0002484295 /DNA_START=63 /DNA_END=850 /DNA_ORIENTATION=-